MVSAVKLSSLSPSQKVSDASLIRSSHPTYRAPSFLIFFYYSVSHIFPIGQVHNERRKFREACETAAATASTIFHVVSFMPRSFCLRCRI